MPLISHELPKSLFPIHNLINDYPYVLAHLINRDTEYTDFYVKKCKTASYSILDNSAFELGKSVEYETLLDAAVRIKPTHVVIPDWVNNCDKTIELAESFLTELNKTYSGIHKVPFKLIAVLQGTSMEEILKCLHTYAGLKILGHPIDTIALPYDTLPDSDYHNIRYIIFQMIKEIVRINDFKVHLLGLQNYSEYLLYSEEDKKLIYSVDSSAPIVYGWNKIKFGPWGTTMLKPREKLADNLDRPINSQEMDIIAHNVLVIREILK